MGEWEGPPVWTGQKFLAVATVSQYYDPKHHVERGREVGKIGVFSNIFWWGTICTSLVSLPTPILVDNHAKASHITFLFSRILFSYALVSHCVMGLTHTHFLCYYIQYVCKHKVGNVIIMSNIYSCMQNRCSCKANWWSFKCLGIIVKNILITDKHSADSF